MRGVAENDHRARLVGFIEWPSEWERHAERGEVVGGDLFADCDPAVQSGANHRSHAAVCDHRFEGGDIRAGNPQTPAPIAPRSVADTPSRWSSAARSRSARRRCRSTRMSSGSWALPVGTAGARVFRSELVAAGSSELTSAATGVRVAVESAVAVEASGSGADNALGLVSETACCGGEAPTAGAGDAAAVAVRRSSASAAFRYPVDAAPRDCCQSRIATRVRGPNNPSGVPGSKPSLRSPC